MEQLETEIYLRYKQIIESQKAWSSSCHAGQVLFDHLQLLLLSGHDPRMGTASPFSRAAPQSSWIYSGTGSPFSCENAQSRSVTLPEIIDSYDAFCFDGYGIFSYTPLNSKEDREKQLEEGEEKKRRRLSQVNIPTSPFSLK